MKRFCSILLVLVLLSPAVLPVQAAEVSGWKEILEYNSLNADGSNIFTVPAGGGTLKIPLDTKQRLRKIDMLIWHPTGQRFTSASVTVATVGTTNLDVLAVGGNICRVSGYLPNAWYTEINVQLNRSSSGSAMYELLSCKVTTLGVQEFLADAEITIQGNSHPQATAITVPGVSSGSGVITDQIRIDVYDWMKFDTLTIWGSAVDFPINSIRATIGTAGVPFTVSYCDSIAGGYWYESDEFESGYTDDNIYSGEDWTTGESDLIPTGKTLFCLTFDLTGLDRTTGYELIVYMTGLYEPVWGYTFTCQYVNGSISTADTEKVTWWNKFKAFFTDLFSPSDPDAEQFGDSMESQAGELQDAVDEMDQVTKPDLDDLDVSLDEYLDPGAMSPVNDVLGSIFSNEVIVTMLIITLTCAFVSYALFGKR